MRKDKITLLPSQEELQRLFDYNPVTGVLYWKSRPRSDFKSDRQYKVWNKRYSGTAALHGISKGGYRVGHLFGIMAKSHRVIWKLMTGVEADKIDHENGDRADNIWTNLKSVTTQVNSKNRKEYATNKSGVSGVYWNKALDKWHAQIRVENVRVHIGYFDNLEDARKARAKAEKSYDFHANHGRKVG
mgnify:CR=1 FL=1